MAYDAGHILGSTSLELTITEDGKKFVVVFSGDVGRYDQPILKDPTTPPSHCDLLFVRIDVWRSRTCAGQSGTDAGGCDRSRGGTRRIDCDSGVCDRADADVYVLPARNS